MAEKSLSSYSWTGKRERRRPGPYNTLQGHNPSDLSPPTRSHFLKIPPSLNCAKLGTKTLARGPLGDTADPNHSSCLQLLNISTHNEKNNQEYLLSKFIIFIPPNCISCKCVHAYVCVCTCIGKTSWIGP